MFGFEYYTRFVHRMVRLGLLPNFKIDIKHKCEVCTESKFTKQSYKSIQEKSNELLGLIHSDLFYFKSILTNGNFSQVHKTYQII